MGDTREPAANEVITWHHGLIATWWANFNLDGPEIDFFGAYVTAGQPALDVACGSGRLLVPWVAAGMDVDGVDASADMIAACRAAAEGVGRDPALYVQPTHLLDLPRSYDTIVMCGSIGLGVTRDQDLQGLRRMMAHLNPGGTLLVDYEVGEFDPDRVRSWQPHPVDASPPAADDRRLGPDGFHYALRLRVTAIDPDAATVTREMQAWQWHGDELVAHETHSLFTNIYSTDDIATMLTDVGFVDVRMVGGYHGGEPTEADKFVVFVAAAPTTT